MSRLIYNGFVVFLAILSTTQISKKNYLWIYFAMHARGRLSLGAKTFPHGEEHIHIIALVEKWKEEKRRFEEGRDCIHGAATQYVEPFYFIGMKHLHARLSLESVGCMLHRRND